MRGNQADIEGAEPRYERFRVHYPGGTVIDYVTDGSTLREAQVLHPLAVVEPVEVSK